MKKKFIFLLILMILMLISIISLLFIRYNNYMKYDESKFKMVTFEKDVDDKAYTISILIPSHFEKKLEYELITKLEEKIKKENDIKKRHLLERQLITDTYYYGYEEIIYNDSPPRYCFTYIRYFEVKLKEREQQNTVVSFLDYYKNNEYYKTLELKNNFSNFDIIEIKKSCFENNYYIFLENKKYVLELFTSLPTNITDKEELNYINSFIKLLKLKESTSL